jgi:RNA polymerase sigma-70 factor (ECF subfamily)
MAPDLEPYRRYLTVLASVHFDPRLRGKLDPADLVQQTFVRATAAAGDLRSREPGVVLAWLRSILANELLDAAKHFDRDKRDVARERSIEADLDRSASGLTGWLAGDFTSPSVRAAANEELLRLADALAELPDKMRTVCVLKHCQGLSLAEVASRLGTSVPAVASLLRRGLEQLRTRLGRGDPSHDE